MSDEIPPFPPGPQLDPQTGHPAGEQPPAYPPYQPPVVPGYGPYQVPELPKATTAMVLGIVSLAGAAFCLLPILLAPVAWIVGAQARREIRSAPQHWSGESKATAGMVLGILGTVVLALALLGVLIIVLVLLNSSTTVDTGTRV